MRRRRAVGGRERGVGEQMAVVRARKRDEADGARGANPGDPVLAAHQVRMATLALDELVGAVDVEEVLERIFSSFCIGK